MRPRSTKLILIIIIKTNFFCKEIEIEITKLLGNTTEYDCTERLDTVVLLLVVLAGKIALAAVDVAIRARVEV